MVKSFKRRLLPVKYLTYPSFKKHLQESVSFQGVYAVICQDAQERKIFVKEIFGKKKQENSSLELSFISTEDVDFAGFVTSLESIDLFSSAKVFVLRNIEKASKSFLENLSSYLEKRPEVFLIVEGEKLEKSFYETLKKSLVALDLSLEKPWDRKARIVFWLAQYVKRDKKQLSPIVADKLYERCDKDFALMLQELNKLVCFTEEELITEKHLDECFFQKAEEKLWNLAESVIFDPASKEVAAFEPDLAEFSQMLPLLRMHLQTAAKLQSLKEQNLLSEIKEYLPSLSQKNEQKYLAFLQKCSPKFSEKALLHLFEIEKKSRSISVGPDILWTKLLYLLKSSK